MDEKKTKYQQEVEKAVQKLDKMLTEKDLEEILYLFENGILTEQGKIREYDPIDFKLKYPDIEINEIIKYIEKKFGHDESSEFARKFSAYADRIDKIGSLDDKKLDDLLTMKVEIFCEKDHRGLPIIGTGRYMEIEEMQNLIDFVKINNLPKNDRMVSLVQKRYIEKTLIIPGNEEYMTEEYFLNHKNKKRVVKTLSYNSKFLV